VTLYITEAVTLSLSTEQVAVHFQVLCGYQTKWLSFPHVLQASALV